MISGLGEAERRAAAAGDRVDELGLRLDRAAYELIFEPTDRASERLRELAQDALPVFEAAGVDWGLAVAWNAVLIAEIQQGRSAGVAAAAERAIEHARRADHHVLVSWAETQLVLAHYQGATPVEQCLRWLDAHPDFERRNVLPYRDRLLAMLGRFDEANQLLAESAERILGLGAPRPRMWLAFRRFEVAMLDGDASRAEAAAREGCEIVEALGDLGNFMWFYSYLAQALLALGRDDEADQWLQRGQTAPSEERPTQMVWRQARGRVLARRGEHQEGERLAREAVALAAETDMLNAHGDALLDLAEVLALAVRRRDCPCGAGRGARPLERKGNPERSAALRAARAQPPCYEAVTSFISSSRAKGRPEEFSSRLGDSGRHTSIASSNASCSSSSVWPDAKHPGAP